MKKSIIVGFAHKPPGSVHYRLIRGKRHGI